LPISGGWLPDGAATNFWQLGYNVVPASATTAMVEACVSAYSQTVAMCPGAHWRLTDKGGRERVTNSAAGRMLKHPNAYQSISDFLLNAVRQLYLDGNAYALALRNERYEINELHLMDSALSAPQLAMNGEVFYRLVGNQVIERQIETPLMVPQRDVLHIRLHVDRSRRYPFPLWGQSPLLAAMNDISVTQAINQQQLQFYQNQARPSAVLSTDLQLDKDQTQALRDRWDEQSRGINQGRTPILTSGLKVQPWAAPPKDAQIAEILKMSNEQIALAFRVPLQILGLGGGTSFRSIEALIQFWLATGLGFALNHVEEAFGLLFKLKGQPDEYIEFDTAALMRSAMKDRIEALARGVQGGIFSPNEARNEEGYDDVPYGDSPRVQQQVVPLEFAGKVPAPPAPHAPPAAPLGESAAAPKKPPSNDNAVKHDVEREIRNLYAAAARAGRRYSA
jgi:HK97 family phage portal protein